MDYDKFISLFDQAQDRSLVDILEPLFYEKVLNNTVYQNNLEKDFESKMFAFINREDSIKVRIQDLRKRLTRQFLWKNNDKNQQYLDVFNLLFIRFGIQDTYSSQDSDWVCAIIMAKYYIENFDNKRDKYIQQLNIDTSLLKSIEACDFFHKKGFIIRVRKGLITRNSTDAIFKFIDTKVNRLGHSLYLVLTDSINKLLLNESNNLYKFSVNSSTEHKEEILPYGFLLQLAMKHICQEPRVDNDEDFHSIIRDLFELSKNYALLFELQGFGLDYEMMANNNTDDMLDKLIKIITTDNFYKIEQYEPNDVFDFVTFLAKKYDKYKDVCNFIEIIKFTRELIGKDKNNFCASDLSPLLANSTTNIEKYLNNFTHDNNINNLFNNYDDFDKVNSIDKPFIKINEYYLILETRFFSIAFYRVLQNILLSCGEDYKVLNIKFGDYLEEYMYFKLKEKNIEYIGAKKYKLSKQKRADLYLKSEELECDLVISNSEHILFIEIKKKELTKFAKKGNLFYLLDDLSKSLIASQIQANRHMRYIYNYDEIIFKDGTELPLDDREVLKMSLSSLDYLSLHSKDVFSNFLRLLYNKELTSTEDKKLTSHECSILLNFNENLLKFTNEISNENSIFQMEHVNGFLNSFYLNIFHFLYVLKNSKNEQEFIDNLLVSRRVSIQAYRDFYHEHDYIKKLKFHESN